MPWPEVGPMSQPADLLAPGTGSLRVPVFLSGLAWCGLSKIRLPSVVGSDLEKLNPPMFSFLSVSLAGGAFVRPSPLRYLGGEKQKIIEPERERAQVWCVCGLFVSFSPAFSHHLVASSDRFLDK